MYAILVVCALAGNFDIVKLSQARSHWGIYLPRVISPNGSWGPHNYLSQTIVAQLEIVGGCQGIARAWLGYG